MREPSEAQKKVLGILYPTGVNVDNLPEALQHPSSWPKRDDDLGGYSYIAACGGEYLSRRASLTTPAARPLKLSEPSFDLLAIQDAVEAGWNIALRYWPIGHRVHNRSSQGLMSFMTISECDTSFCIRNS